MAKKIKKSNILLLISLAVFLILIIQLVFFFNAEPTIKINYVAEFNKLTKPVDYDPNQNAYFDYEKSANLFKNEPEEMSAYRPTFPTWPGDMNDTQLNILKQWLSENSEALEFFEKGSLKKYCWFEAPEESWNTSHIVLPLFNKMCSLIQVINWRARLYAFENKTKIALDDILTSYKAANQFSGPQKTLVDQLLAKAMKALTIVIAFEVLSNKRFDAEILEEFQHNLEKEISRSEKKFHFEAEKIFAYDVIQRVFTDNGKGNGHLIPKEYKKLFPGPIIIGNFKPSVKKPASHSFFDWVRRILYQLCSSFSQQNNDDTTLSDLEIIWLALKGPDRRQTIKMLDKVVVHLDKLQYQTPWHLYKKAINPEQQLKVMLRSYIIKAYAGSFRTLEMAHKLNTSESAFITTISLFRYKNEKGFYPDSLSELLKAGYINELPLDPYNDGPLTYRKTDDNFTLYSFGPDFDDDGGRIDRDYRGNIRQWEDEGDTVFWPRPKETEQERQKRLEEQNKTPEQIMEEIIKSYSETQDANDINSVKS